MKGFTSKHLAVLALVAATPAGALDLIPRDEGFMKEPTSVSNRTYALSGTKDLAILGAISIKNTLTEFQGATLSFDYSFNEYLALDVFAGGGAGRLTSLAKKIREKVKGTKADDLRDSGALLATAQIGIRFTPFYGKINLAAEIPLHVSLYFDAGAGFGLVNWESVLTCSSNKVGGKCPNESYRTELRPNVAVNFGGGFRFFVNKTWSARIEVRDVIYPDAYYEGITLNTPATGSGGGTTATNDVGITHTPLVMAGVGILF